MTSETPVSSATRGLSVRDERSEGSGRHFITFETPSDDTLRELHVRVKDGVNSGSIPLADIELPQLYPFTNIRVDFESWYRRPRLGGDYPSRESGYKLKVTAPLINPTKIHETTAKAILELLQASTGLGRYDQMPNGKHQIVIPGKDGSMPGHTQKWQDGTTVLELGVDSMERGVESMLKRYKAEDQSHKDYFAERISQLATESTKPLENIAILLQTNYADTSGVDAGEHYDLSGWQGNFAPSENQINPFLENSGYLLEAVSRGLGGRNLPPVSIPVEFPSELSFFPHALIARR